MLFKLGTKMIDLPPQIETQIIQIAKQQNISIDEYVLLAVQEKLAKEQEKELEKMYDFLGFRPLPSPPNPQVITNDYINELREEYGI